MLFDPVLDVITSPRGPPAKNPFTSVLLIEPEISEGVAFNKTDPVLIGYDKIIIPEPPDPPANG